MTVVPDKKLLKFSAETEMPTREELIGFWQRHNRLPQAAAFPDYFDASATILFIPTGVSLHGLLEIGSHMQHLRELHFLTKTKTLSTSADATTGTVFDESVYTIDHQKKIEWLLPGIQPTSKELTVIITTVIRFDGEGRCLSKRVYWDQAGLLKQLGIITGSAYARALGKEVVLPVAARAEDVVERVKAIIDSSGSGAAEESGTRTPEEATSKASTPTVSVFEKAAEPSDLVSPVTGSTRTSVKLHYAPGGRSSISLG
ncbi:hypothetical protein HDU96_009366 [Phlyctochytrium bullatum]|nr:hypothetical protein HDU96_009366 [Phlyctochytrium bullatum]